MKFPAYILIIGIMLSASPAAIFATSDPDDDSDEGGSSVVGSTVVGGLLGGGLGTAIGSASGNAGKGAMIGAGIGALGGLLMGKNKDDQARRDREYKEAVREEREARQAQYAQQQYVTSAREPQSQPVLQPKKKIVREYDAAGNMISEKEVPVN
ncbi:MAG: glycine zipper domain-containing protein [Candidatus Omnitrophota bacterium]